MSSREVSFGKADTNGTTGTSDDASEEDVEARIQALESTVERLIEENERLNQRVESLEGRSDAYEAQIGRLKACVMEPGTSEYELDDKDRDMGYVPIVEMLLKGDQMTQELEEPMENALPIHEDVAKYNAGMSLESKTDKRAAAVWKNFQNHNVEYLASEKRWILYTSDVAGILKTAEVEVPDTNISTPAKRVMKRIAEKAEECAEYQSTKHPDNQSGNQKLVIEREPLEERFGGDED